MAKGNLLRQHHIKRYLSNQGGSALQDDVFAAVRGTQDEFGADLVHLMKAGVIGIEKEDAGWRVTLLERATLDDPPPVKPAAKSKSQVQRVDACRACQAGQCWSCISYAQAREIVTTGSCGSPLLCLHNCFPNRAR